MSVPEALAQAHVFFITASPLSSYMTRRPHHIFKRLSRIANVVNVSSSRKLRGHGIFRRLPGDKFSLVRVANRRLFRRHVEHLARSTPKPPIIWVWGPPQSWLWRGIPRKALIYELTDYIPGFPGKEGLLRETEKTISEADVVFVVSRPLLAWAKALNENSFLIQNGVDPDAFSSSARAEKSAIGYWGAIGPWVRIELLEAVADAFPDTELRIAARVHPEAEDGFSRLLGRPNVRYSGEIGYEKLPEFLEPVGVGLIPFETGPLGNSTSPLKLYEAFAAGAGVVSTGIDEAIFHRERGVLEIGDDPEGFVEAARRMMAERNPSRLSEKARENSWDARFGEVLSILGRIL
ncbi:MAG: glycosyltransferase [candidate division WOR-3 bacterium]